MMNFVRQFFKSFFFTAIFLLCTAAYPMCSDYEPDEASNSDDEIDDLCYKISDINVNGTGYGFLPKELLLVIFTNITCEYPWQKIKVIYDLAKVCKRWNFVILTGPKAIREALCIKPLCWAAALGQADEIIKLKLKYGFSLREPDAQMFRPAHYAIGNGQLDCIKMLLVGKALDTIDQEIEELFPYIQKRDEQVVVIMMSIPDSEKTEEVLAQAAERLFDAAKSGEYDTVLSILLSNPNMGYIYCKEYDEFISSVPPKIYDLLLYNVQAATEHIIFDSMDELVGDQAGLLGQTFREFRSYSANPNAINHTGETLLHSASRDPVYLPVLQELLACDTINLDARTLGHRDGLIGLTALHIAAYRGAYACLQELLNVQGCNVNVVSDNEFGQTPLHVAASYGQTECGRLLIEHGAVVNALSKSLATPLHNAAAKGKLEIVKLLCAHGADKSLKNAEGDTALEIAQLRGHGEVVEFLI